MDLVARFEWDVTQSPTLALFITVADLLDIHPTKLDPLYPHIDPDALDAIFVRTNDPTRNGAAHIEFSYYDYHVEIRNDGEGFIFDKTEVREADGNSKASV